MGVVPHFHYAGDTAEVEESRYLAWAPWDDGETAHIACGNLEPICGAVAQAHIGHHYADNNRQLCSCGAPVCRHCRRILELWERTGIYEGAE